LKSFSDTPAEGIVRLTLSLRSGTEGSYLTMVASYVVREEIVEVV